MSYHIEDGWRDMATKARLNVFLASFKCGEDRIEMCLAEDLDLEQRSLSFTAGLVWPSYGALTETDSGWRRVWHIRLYRKVLS